MKIGKFDIGEYGLDVTESLGCQGWIEPESKGWILFFFDDGSAQLYTDRSHDGGIIGEPLRIGGGDHPDMKIHVVTRNIQ